MCTFAERPLALTLHTQDQTKKKSELIPLYKPLNLPMERPEARLYAPCCVCDVLFPRGNIINDLINEELALVLVTKSSSLRARTTMFVVRTTSQLPHFYLLPVPFLSPPTPPKLLLLQELPQTYTYKHTPHIYQNTQDPLPAHNSTPSNLSPLTSLPPTGPLTPVPSSTPSPHTPAPRETILSTHQFPLSLHNSTSYTPVPLLPCTSAHSIPSPHIPVHPETTLPTHQFPQLPLSPHTPVLTVPSSTHQGPQPPFSPHTSLPSAAHSRHQLPQPPSLSTHQ